MRLAKEMPELIDSNCSRTNNLPSIAAAIALLSAPDEIKEEFKEAVAEGKTFTEAEIKAAIEAAKAEADERVGNWRSQALKERDEKRKAEDLVAAKVKEAKDLRETIERQIEIGVKDALKAETAEIQRAMAEAKENEKAAKDRIKAMREQRAKDHFKKSYCERTAAFSVPAMGSAFFSLHGAHCVLLLKQHKGEPR